AVGRDEILVLERKEPREAVLASEDGVLGLAQQIPQLSGLDPRAVSLPVPCVREKLGALPEKAGQAQAHQARPPHARRSSWARKSHSASPRASGHSSIGACPQLSNHTTREPLILVRNSWQASGGVTTSCLPQIRSVGVLIRAIWPPRWLRRAVRES